MTNSLPADDGLDEADQLAVLTARKERLRYLESNFLETKGRGSPSNYAVSRFYRP